MNPYRQLNFPHFDFRLRNKDGVPYIWDDLRKQWLLLTPEEWVRRHFVRYLTECLGVPHTSITQEHPAELAGMKQRADIVVYDTNGRINTVIECKAATIPLTKEIFAQAMRYNTVLKGQYVIITNGLSHYCFELNPQTNKYTQLPTIPQLYPNTSL